MNRTRIALALTAVLTLTLFPGLSPAAAQEGMPFVTVTGAPEDSELEAGEHIAGQEFTDTRPVANGHVDPAPAFLADDEYGCAWATARSSGAENWIGVARRGQGTDLNPDDPQPDRCAGFQTKFTTARAAGASALIVVSHVPVDGSFLAAADIPGVMVSPEDGNRLIAALEADADAVELSLRLLDSQTFLPSWEVADTEVTTLLAEPQDGTVDVSGDALFRGEPPVVVGTDPEGNPPGHAALAQLGLDATAIALRQADPNVPEVEFIVRVTDLPSTPLPEVVRYLWQFQIDGEEYWVQAKTSDFTTATAFSDDPAGTATNVPGSFRLRGDCGLVEPTPNVTSCKHLAWLDGAFDPTRDEVRVRVPLGRSVSPEIAAGAVLDGAVMDASLQAVISNATTSNTVTQFTPYEFPQRTVQVGIVPSGQDPEFTDTATLDRSKFSATLDTAGLASGSYDVWVRACFGVNCGEEMTTITL